MIRRAAITLALACAATMAQATPPDMIHIEDELFGFSPDHVYLLRKSHDNLGLYSAYVRNVALVAIDRHTGDEQIWPVWRIRSVPDQDKDPHKSTRCCPQRSTRSTELQTIRQQDDRESDHRHDTDDLL